MAPGRGADQRSSGRPPAALLALLDWTINLCVLSPLCVLHWRGTWQLLDRYLFADRLDLSGLSSAALGYAVCGFCYAAQDPLRAFLLTSDVRWPRLLASRAYTVLFAFGLVNLWRGVWHLLDHGFGKGWMSGLGSALFGVVALAGSRTLRNITSPPIGMATDHLDDAYTYAPTMFRTKQTFKRPWLHPLDVAYSVVVVGSLVVFVWRGLWTILDVFLFPESKALSAWSSLAMGYGVTLLAFAVQPLAVALSARLKSRWRRAVFEDVFILFASVGAINVWRGVWGVADYYIWPENPLLSNALTSVIGMLGSIVLFAGNNILARGVYKDGEMTDGSGCAISEPYLTRIFECLAPERSLPGTRLESVVAADHRPAAAWKVNGGNCKEDGVAGLAVMPCNDVLVSRGVTEAGLTTPEAEVETTTPEAEVGTKRSEEEAGETQTAQQETAL